MKLQETFKQAKKVLQQINKNASKNVAQTYYVEMYQNGREKGFHLAGGDVAVSFAENRSSDDIVVYLGKRFSFDMQGNVPSQEAYEARKFFPYGEYEKAAKYILESIEDSAEEYQHDLVKVRRTIK